MPDNFWTNVKDASERIVNNFAGLVNMNDFIICVSDYFFMMFIEIGIFEI